MNRLRTLAGIALIAGVFAGLTSCANKKGDLGAELDVPPSIAIAETPHRSVLDIASPADIPDADTVELQDPKNRTPQSVSVSRDANIASIAKNPKADQQNPTPKADSNGDKRLPDALDGEVVAIAAGKAVPKKAETKVDAPKVDEKKSDADPVAPETKVAVAEAKIEVKQAAKEDVKVNAPKAEEKSVEAAPVVAVPVAPVVPIAPEAKVTVAEAKLAPKEEAIAVAPKSEATKVEVPVVSTPVEKEKTADVTAIEKTNAALALLNKVANEAARALPAKPAATVPEVVAPIVPVVAPQKQNEVKPAPVEAPQAPSQVADENVKKDDKPAPKPVDPPVVAETDAQRAERLLKEAAKITSVQREADARQAEASFQAGMRLYNDWNYEQAKTYFEKALSIDPSHELARARLADCKSLLNIDMGMGSRMQNLANEERVAIQERQIMLARLMEEGHSLEARGSETVLDSGTDQKIASISERMRFLEQAQDRYRRVIEIINWMPPAAELPGVRRQAEEAMLRVRGKIDKDNEEVRYNNRSAALRAAQLEKTKDVELWKIRIDKMLAHTDELISVHEYKAAERMALHVLELDPLNVNAEKLKNKARSLAHQGEHKDFQEMYRNEYRSQFQDVDEASISSAPLIQYPQNWDQISKRSDVSIGRKVAEEPWKAEIRKKLQRKVALEFVDAQLADVIGQMRSLSGVTMIIDPKVLQAAPPPINLRVPDMNLDVALDWILKLGELEYVLQDHAIYIGKPQTLQAPLEMRIYDVSDLTQNIQDFPGPEFQITVAGDKGAAGGGGGLSPFGGGGAKTQPPTNATIQEMIKTRIMPLSWDPATGASIEEKGGKLVVMQRPEIHSLIEKLLSNFRSTQKMMINIESRFLSIREAYLEQTGVEFQGLDPNVLFGDFGDLRRLAAPTGFLQPRVPASTDTTPPNAPFPGFVSGPSKQSGGLISTVGSIVNHVINFFPNDPSTISASDTTNSVRQGGLSAQVSILNNAQVQAFIRAMAVRENSSTLIAPRLTVFNTQRANMFVARQQSYVSDYEISGDAYDPVVRQFLVGVVLDVKPIVSSDRRYVTLELRPTVTELTNLVTRQIDTFQVNSGANVNVLVFLSFPIQFPELSIQKVRTTATVPDGGIMLIGGLYKNVKFNAENGVPFMSDLPVIGRLFRWNTVDNAKSNLAILISPRIILFNEEEEKLLH